ncbi:hypothetical protein SmuNN2025_1684 [Streptococcus mutans NN2025]|nr:hypothetical protein SmuNN2025_1684 [Streptococcus mutans NN2025]
MKLLYNLLILFLINKSSNYWLYDGFMILPLILHYSKSSFDKLACFIIFLFECIWLLVNCSGWHFWLWSWPRSKHCIGASFSSYGSRSSPQLLG